MFGERLILSGVLRDVALEASKIEFLFMSWVATCTKNWHYGKFETKGSLTLIRVTGRFVFALCGLFGRANSATGNTQRPTSAKEAFPLSVEVIPGKLKVKVFLHDIHYENETIPCWSYLTDGF